MERLVGTVSRGIRAPIIREGDDIAKIVADSVLNAAESDSFSIGDRDVIAVTEAVVARAQGLPAAGHGDTGRGVPLDAARAEPEQAHRQGHAKVKRALPARHQIRSVAIGVHAQKLITRRIKNSKRIWSNTRLIAT